jgi:uncharacterized coiled-coil protein SlyX
MVEAFDAAVLAVSRAFADRLDDLATVQASLRDPRFAADGETLAEAGARVAELEARFAEIEEEIAAQEQCVEDAQAFCDEAHVQRVAVDRMRRHLPSEVLALCEERPARRVSPSVAFAPVPTLAKGSMLDAVENYGNNSGMGERGAAGGSRGPRRGGPRRRGGAQNNSGRGDSAPAETQSPRPASSSTPSAQFPAIELVSERELATCPSYMRGRMSCDKINAIVEDIHLMLEAKYSVLQRGDPRRMKGPALELYEKWRKEETKETAGMFFFSETDLTLPKRSETAVLKFDATGKAALTILQHLRRIRSIPGRMRRYAVLTE